MEVDQLSYAKNEWSKTKARKAVHRAGGTEDRDWKVGDVE